MSRFLKLFFAILGGGLTLVAAVNVAVDPYASFRFDDIAGFNDQKRLKRGGGRVNKSVILDRYAFDSIFLGTSTVETGLDPRSSVLDGQRAYNAGLPFSGMRELDAVARYIAEHQSPKRIVIGLDFASFGDRRGPGGDFAESGFAGRSTLPIYLERLFSAQSLGDSVSVVRDSVRGKVSPFSKYGNYDPKAAGAHPDIRAQFVSSLDVYISTAYANFRYDHADLDLLRDAVAALGQNDTEVVLFISPLPALHQAAIDAVGLRPDFERWKRDLANLVADMTDVEASLWDFATYNAVTSQPVGASSDPSYWDAAHYTASVGNLILCRIADCSRLAVPAEFGVRLTAREIDDILARQRRAPSGLLADFSPELAAKARDVRQNRTTR